MTAIASGQTLEEKCADLIGNLARYGKRADPNMYAMFTHAAERKTQGGLDVISTVKVMAPDIFHWANTLERRNSNLSRNLSLRDEWNTVVQATDSIGLMIENGDVTKPKGWDIFLDRLQTQKKALETMERKHRQAMRADPSWGRD